MKATLNVLTALLMLIGLSCQQPAKPQPVDTLTARLPPFSIYSGQCTYYKKAFKEKNVVSFTPVSQGFAKVVINRKEKKFYFYFNNQLVFHYFNYMSELDERGSEGFTFDSDADADREIAEKRFELNTEMEMGGQLGYQYEITNYTQN